MLRKKGAVMTLLGECGIEGSYKENVFLQEQLLFLKMTVLAVKIK
jgi:hypothetical protein